MVGTAMDLKDVILSTLAELEKGGDEQPRAKRLEPLPEPVEQRPIIQNEDSTTESKESVNPYQAELDSQPSQIVSNPIDPDRKLPVIESQSLGEELRLLTSLRERILVLFEGLQSPNNTNIEAKVDLILNFLEYELAVIDERIEQISRR